MIIYNKSNSNLARFLELIPRGRNTTARFVRALRKGSYLWDPWILKDGNVYRLFYLRAAKPTPSVDFWSQGTIYGAVSTDLKNWQSTGIVLEPEPNNIWESGRMMAGSTYKENGIYYLFYSASGGGELLKDERIGLATSTDGINWQRSSANPFFSIEERDRWYGVQKDKLHFHWRDPYIVKDHISGKYYMFISAHLKHETLSPYEGCVGLAVSDNMAGPYELLPPVASSTISGIEDWPFVEMERPQVIFKNGKYHMFFSSWNWNLNPNWSRKLPEQKFTCSSLYWLTSDKITGPFKMKGKIPLVKGSEGTGLYASNLFPWTDNSEEFLLVGWYHHIYSLEVSPLFKAYFKDDSIEIARV